MRRLILLLLIGLVTTSCITVYNPATKREEFILIGTRAEVILGKEIDYQIRKEYTVCPDQAMQERARRIGKNIARVCDRKDVKFHFLVLESKGNRKEINAFSTPGGFVYIFKDLMQETNEDELAGVIGHEVGHIAAKHAVKRIQAAIGYDILMNLIFRGKDIYVLRRVMGVVSNLITLGYSRQDELQADRLGVRYAYRAGYNPYGLISFMKKLEKLEKDDTSEMFSFMRTHPPLKVREELLKQEILHLKQKDEQNKNKDEQDKNYNSGV